MSWLIGKLKCWFGYHEELMCGGHRAGWDRAAAQHEKRCISAYCPRCGDVVGRLEPIGCFEEPEPDLPTATAIPTEEQESAWKAWNK